MVPHGIKRSCISACLASRCRNNALNLPNPSIDPLSRHRRYEPSLYESQHTAHGTPEIESPPGTKCMRERPAMPGYCPQASRGPLTTKPQQRETLRLWRRRTAAGFGAAPGTWSSPPGLNNRAPLAHTFILAPTKTAVKWGSPISSRHARHGTSGLQAAEGPFCLSACLPVCPSRPHWRPGSEVGVPKTGPETCTEVSARDGARPAPVMRRTSSDGVARTMGPNARRLRPS